MTLNQEAFKKILKEQGLKVTNQRLLVLEVLEKHRGEHMTAEDIYELVKVDYPEIGLATVYRTVQLLLELQLVDRINLDDGCKSCGKVWSFEDDLLEELESYIERKTDFHVLDHELKFYGQCKECAERESAEKRK